MEKKNEIIGKVEQVDDDFLQCVLPYKHDIYKKAAEEMKAAIDSPLKPKS